MISVGLRFKPKASNMLDKHSPIKLHPKARNKFVHKRYLRGIEVRNYDMLSKYQYLIRKT